MNETELWESAKSLLLDGISPTDLKSVFMNLLKPMGVFGDSIVFIAESEQVKEWVESHYLADMRQALEAVYGQPMTIGIGTTEEHGAQNAPAPKAGASQNTDATPQEPEWLNTYVSPSDIAQQHPGSFTSTPLETRGRQTEDTRNEALFTKCTFDTFVVGRSNEFARGAALAVAEQPGTAYNPLFIYGNSGLGKTHLLVAIANYTKQNFPSFRTCYAAANDFLNDYVSSAQKNEWGGFNSKYHGADVFLMDDVQYLVDKGETVHQLFNIFNEMTSRNKQIVLSADRAPRDIDMEERMRSRFSSGVLADIKPPDYETRLAILKNYTNRMCTQTNFYGIIPDEVLAYLAEASTSNVREIEGAVTRIISNMSLLGKNSISLEEAEELFEDFFPNTKNRQIEIATIMRETERYFGISHEDMVSMKRNKGITLPRHVAIYLARYLTEESLEAIGKKFGGRDHSTIMHSVSKIESELKKNRTLFDQVEQLTVKIKERS